MPDRITIRIEETTYYFSDWDVNELHDLVGTPEEDREGYDLNRLVAEVREAQCRMSLRDSDRFEDNGNVESAKWSWRPEGKEF